MKFALNFFKRKSSIVSLLFIFLGFSFFVTPAFAEQVSDAGGTVTLSGRILDPLGNPLPNVTIGLQSDGSQTALSITDTFGKYSLQAPSGTYTVEIGGNVISTYISSSLALKVNNYSLTQNKIVDIIIPAERISLHTQGEGDNAAAGTYDVHPLVTDASGSATMWLIPTDSGTIATPSADSPYIPFSLSKITASKDKDLLTSLQSNHDMPALTLTSENKAPQVNLLSFGNINVGVTYIEEGLFIDQDSKSWTATVDYGDGAGAQPLTLNPDKTFSLSHQYTTPGTYTLTVVINDDQESIATKRTTIHVNASPSINPFGGGAINQAGTYTQNSSFTDPDSNLWIASVDYGDGSGEHPLELTGTNFTLYHTYTTAGPFTVTVKVADSKRAYDIETAFVTVNAAPAIEQLNGTSMNKGGTYTENGSFIDNDSTSWTATVNYGDGFGEQSLPLTEKTFVLSHQYPTAGTFAVTVKVTDNQGAIQTRTVAVLSNGEPQFNPLTSAMIPEGATYASIVSFSDTDSIAWNGTVDYGDGFGVQPVTINPNKTFSLSHLYKNNGTYAIIVNGTDNQGLIATGSAMVTVNNLSPGVGDITVLTAHTGFNTAITVAASFIDAGVMDNHTAVWHWGDGTTSAGTVTEASGSGTVTGTHTYTAAGVYAVTVGVEDNDGAVGSSSKFSYVTVYDPNSAAFSGSNEFDSPAGAVFGNPSALGKANFGVEAKYEGTTTIPIGKAKLNFSSGNIEFESLSYSQLVIIGQKAILMGDGMLNGIPGYTFFISAIDNNFTGVTDYVRYKIKDPSGNVVYDTQPGALDMADPTTPVSKGKIKIQ